VTSSARAERLARWCAQLDTLPDRVRSVLEAPLDCLGPPLAPPRAVVTTGLGSSEAHARLLAHLLADEGGLEARFVPTGRLHGGAPAGRRRTTLVVVSQGLGANARLALEDASAWERVVVVTAVTPRDEGHDRARVRFAEQLLAAGATCVCLPVEADHGALVRIEGPMLGYAVVWRLAQTWLGVSAGPALALEGARVRDAMLAARARMEATLPEAGALRAFFGVPGDAALEAGCGELHLTTSGGYDELASNLALELVEGFRLRHVVRCDAAAFAHGPFQALAGRDASILHLGRADDALDADARLRLERVLSRGRHSMRVLEATLPGAAALFEHQQMLGWLMVRWHEETGLDPTRWSGQGDDAPLYDWGEGVSVARGALASSPAHRLDLATSPEVGRALDAGRDHLIVPLGSTEQHGSHLPQGTDTWIADELARRLVARRPETWAIPALPFGCAREHLAFPGTLSLDEPTLAAVLEDLVRSAVRHRFAGVFVFSAHGGNAEVLRRLSASLGEQIPETRIRVFAELGAVSDAQAKAAAAFGIAAEVAGHHAGEWETSVVAALAPGLVRADALAEGHVASSGDGGSLFYPSLADRVPSGVVGDPRPADPIRADVYLDAWVDVLETDYVAAFSPSAPGRA